METVAVEETIMGSLVIEGIIMGTIMGNFVIKGSLVIKGTTINFLF